MSTSAPSTANLASFVMVTDPFDNKQVAVPTESDGSLSLATLGHGFPGAYGMKYTYPATGIEHILVIFLSTK